MKSFRQYIIELKRAKNSDEIDLFHGTYSDHENFSSIDPNKGKPLGQGSGFYAFGGRRLARNYSKQAQDTVTGVSDNIVKGGKVATPTSKKLMVSTRSNVQHIIPDAELLSHSQIQVGIANDWADKNSERIVAALRKHAAENNVNPETARVRKVREKTLISGVVKDGTIPTYKFEHDTETSRSAKNSDLFDIIHKHDRPLLSDLVKQLHSGDRENFAGRYVGPKITDRKNINLSQV